MKLKQNKLDLADKIQKNITIFLRITLVIAILVSIYNTNWLVVFSTFLVLIATYLHLVIERRYKINLPIEFEFIIILFIYAGIFLGETNSYYQMFWWWDAMLHTISGIAIGFAGFLIMYVLYTKNKIKANPLLIVLFAFCFGVAAGAVWEIFEFVVDQLFNTNMQKNGLVDTMWDLIVDSIGALITSLVGYYYIKGKKLSLFHRLIRKFENENKRWK